MTKKVYKNKSTKFTFYLGNTPAGIFLKMRRCQSKKIFEKLPNQQSHTAHFTLTQVNNDNHSEIAIYFSLVLLYRFTDTCNN